MHRQFCCSVRLKLLVAFLALLPFSVHAETPPFQTGGISADVAVPTRFEFLVQSLPTRLDPKDLPKGADPITETAKKATLSAAENAVKMSADISAQWPKCHFRIASVVQEPAHPSNLQQPFIELTVRVTLLGDSGCLASTK